MKNFFKTIALFGFCFTNLLISCQSEEISNKEPSEFEANQFNYSNFNAVKNIEKHKQLKVLSYNVFLLRDLFFASTTQWGQKERASILSKQEFLRDYDVLMLQECFDNQATNTLRENLKKDFPYQTPIVGQKLEGWDETLGQWQDATPENGGVMIASKHKIEYQAQYLFPKGCDFDGLALKGFAYAIINIHGEKTHFIATHLQSTQPKCNGTEAQVRKQQLKLIKTFIDQKKISSNEKLIYGGDFNIIKDTQEYKEMLEILEVNPPTYKGLTSTWDSKQNAMANYHYPYPKNPREYLDYVFLSNKHQKSSSWFNVVFAPEAKQLMHYTNLTGQKYQWAELSDHYPVEGTIFLDNASWNKIHFKRKYNKIALRSLATNKFISANLKKPNDWLKVNELKPLKNTWFNLVNIENDALYNELKPGKVRVEIHERRNYFWYWQLLNGGAYYYFPNFKNALTQLELVLIRKKQGNKSNLIENGDIVAFKDFSSTSNSYFVQVHYTKGEDWLYLNGSLNDIKSHFEIQMLNN